MAKQGSINAYVLDSSVVIKWFCEEDSTAIALQIREKYIQGKVIIVVPDLLLYEIGNALRYNKNLDKDDVKEAVESIIKLGVDIVVPTKEIMDSAISLAFEHNITLYDAYFVALAKELRFVFVTADEKLYHKIGSSPNFILLKELSLTEKEDSENNH